ncbi:MAG: KH domain-containing protein [Chloroflexi bacterium]|nr:KH domain-containing protein [Chloroflexota bacterium]
MDKKKSVEAVGKTSEEAIARGLAELDMSSDDVIIEMLSETASEARVRLTPYPTEAGRSTPRPVMVGADLGAVGRDVLEHLLKGLGLRATVEVSRGTVYAEEQEEDNPEPPYILNITGNDLSLLIGRKGETLSALQMMTRIITAHKTGQNANLVVDVEHYKARREESLRTLALRLADQVQVKGRTVALEPMPPNERRIIHIALRDHAGVTTLSIGEGEERKVTIIPKK